MMVRKRVVIHYHSHYSHIYRHFLYHHFFTITASPHHHHQNYNYYYQTNIMQRDGGSWERPLSYSGVVTAQIDEPFGAQQRK